MRVLLRARHLSRLFARSRGIEARSGRIAPVLNYLTPRNVSDVRTFLDMAGWYARFIENYAEMKLPINKLTFKGQKWELG